VIDVKDVHFEELRKTWAPQINRLSRSYFIPYMTVEEVWQELELVLFKCQQRYERGHNASFHTYFYRAALNRLGRLRDYNSCHNPTKPSYLIPLDDVVANKVVFEIDYIPSEIYLEQLGFEGLEIDWLMQCKVNRLKLKELAEVTGVTIDELMRVRRRAHKKMKQLRDNKEVHLYESA